MRRYLILSPPLCDESHRRGCHRLSRDADGEQFRRLAMPAAPAAMKAGTATSTTNVPPRRQRITCAEKRPGRAALRYHTRPPRRGIIAGILGSSACRYGGGRDHHRCRASGSLPEVHAEEWILRRTSALRGRKTGGPDGIETPIAGFFRFSTRDRVKRVKPGPCRSAPARPLSRRPSIRRP